jgi:lipopolysaccharide transport system ATP-binding protein
MTKKVSISLENVCVDFPVFNASSLSLKNRVLSKVTGGLIDRPFDKHLIVHGLRNINLHIEAGDRVGIVGHNGSGKTTLLRVLSGIYYPTSGNADIKGNVTSLINIGLGIDPEATGRENIKLRAAFLGITPLEIEAMMEEVIDFTGLGDFINIPFRTYSTGMQLRLAFAVSTIIKSEILIMDEWLSTGDNDFKEKANQRLKKIVDNSEVLILASHSRELLERNCNRLILLEHGKIKVDGNINELLDLYFGADK